MIRKPNAEVILLVLIHHAGPQYRTCGKECLFGQNILTDGSDGVVEEATLLAYEDLGCYHHWDPSSLWTTRGRRIYYRPELSVDMVCSIF